VEKMDPRDDRTSIVRAEFKTYLGNQLKSKSQKPVSPAQNPPALPSVASVLNNIPSIANNNPNGANNNPSSALMPGLSQDKGSPPSLPQLPPLTFSTPNTSMPNLVQPPPRLSSITERNNFTIHERALSFISPSTTNIPATETNGQHERQPTLDTKTLDAKTQPVFPSEANDVPSPSYSSEPPTPVATTTPSRLMVDTNTKIETPSLTLNTSSTVTFATSLQPHHSPTTTLSILTNPHHSPTQSVFTNPHHGSDHSDSPSTINLNHSSLPPLRDLNNNNNTSSLANPSSPTPHSAGSSQAKSVRSPLRTSIENALNPSTLDNPSLAVNSTQTFPIVLLENARTVTNQLTKEGSINDQNIQQSETPNKAEMPQSLQARSGPVTAVKTTGDMANDSKYSSAQRNSMISAAPMSWKSPVIPSAGSRVVGRVSPTRSGLGRKPSGARAQLTPRSYYNRVGPESFSSQTLTEEEESMPEKQNQESLNKNSYDDDNAEALAALTYLDMTDSQDVSTSATPPTPSQLRSPIITPPSVERPRFQLSDGPPIPPATSNPDSVPYRSSFAPSSKVAERIMKAQAQQAAHEAAKHRPGRANGKKKAKTTAAGAWESSDEEDDEEEEDEDEEVDSDAEVPMRGPQSSSSQQGFSSSSSSRPAQSSQYGNSDSNVDGPPSHLRPPRHLPPVPPGRPGKCYDSVDCMDLSNPRTLSFFRGRALSAANSPDDY
jgi:CCR4-NOT transcriptional complex subunit CAF120